MERFKAISDSDVQAIALILNARGQPARYVRASIFYPKSAELELAMNNQELDMNQTWIIHLLLEMFLSQPYIVIPYFEKNENRKTFVHSLPPYIREAVERSATRRSSQNHVITAMDFLNECTTAYQQQADEIKHRIQAFDWYHGIKNANTLIAHTDNVREKVYELCETIIANGTLKSTP